MNDKQSNRPIKLTDKQRKVLLQLVDKVIIHWQTDTTTALLLYPQKGAWKSLTLYRKVNNLGKVNGFVFDNLVEKKLIQVKRSGYNRQAHLTHYELTEDGRNLVNDLWIAENTRAVQMTSPEAIRGHHLGIPIVTPAPESPEKITWKPATFSIDVPGIGHQDLEVMIPDEQPGQDVKIFPDGTQIPVVTPRTDLQPDPILWTRPRIDMLQLAAGGGGLTEQGIPDRFLVHFESKALLAIQWLVDRKLAAYDQFGALVATEDGLLALGAYRNRG